jgi:hypothetical protein
VIHAHITAWLLALILFFVAINLNKRGKTKGVKIIQMILRVLYLLIIATGVGLLVVALQFAVYKMEVLYILKAVVGLWLIGLFEMILSRIINKRKTSIFWIQFAVAWLLVLYLGFVELPMSFLHP